MARRCQLLYCYCLASLSLIKFNLGAWHARGRTKTGTLLVRGLKESYSTRQTAAQVAQNARTGDHFIGYGIYGHGMYVGHSGSFFDSNSKGLSKKNIKAT
jgi:hypothetical protein